MSFDELARDLQENLALVDMLDAQPGPSGNISLLIKELKPMTLRMSPDQNHFRPHLHIDYGKDRHAASFAVDTGELLAGSWKKSKHHKTIESWIAKNRVDLLALWNDLRAGADVTELVTQLKVN